MPQRDLGDQWEVGQGYLLAVALVMIVAALLAVAVVTTVG